MLPFQTEVTFTFDTSNLKILGLGDLKTSDLKEEVIKVIKTGVELETNKS